jgi:predicted transcriptional regulator
MSDDIKTSVRLEPGLHKKLSEAADRDHRSMHAQMVFYIERGLAQDERTAKRATTLAARGGEAR